MGLKEAWDVLAPIGTERTAPAPFHLDQAALPHATIAYAMAGEDLLLRKLFKWRIQHGRMGTYVDLGCADPVSISNTYLFYCLGWRGLCVDANSIWTDRWKQYRPEDIFVNTALGEQEGTAYFFRNKLNAGMAEVTSIPKAPSDQFLPEPETVPIMRLSSLFAKHLGDKKIWFMSMDLEGAELGILKSNDWTRWRPEAILVECADCDSGAFRDHPKVRYLVNLGYKVHSSIFNNVLLVEPHLERSSL